MSARRAFPVAMGVGNRVQCQGKCHLPFAIYQKGLGVRGEDRQISGGTTDLLLLCVPGWGGQVEVLGSRGRQGFCLGGGDLFDHPAGIRVLLWGPWGAASRSGPQFPRTLGHHPLLPISPCGQRLGLCSSRPRLQAVSGRLWGCSCAAS